MSVEDTIPIILIGVNPIEAKGFNKVSIKKENEELLCQEGHFYVHLVGSTLNIEFRPPLSKEDELQSPSE